MRNLKKFLALVLALMMTFSLMVTVNASVTGSVTDIETVTDEFQEAVAVLNGLKIITGYEDGTFRPDKTITRQEATALVYRLHSGDAENTKKDLYSTVDNIAKFKDVDPNGGQQWSAGYIGYCANQEIIKGVSADRFSPTGNVTGYQMLAMVLRAIGYGQNKEYEGTGWQTRVATTATQLGMLKNINDTNYAGTLSAPATRELVAEIVFQAALQPTVTYTPALGYNNKTDVFGGEYNPSLSQINFGLYARLLTEDAVVDIWGRPGYVWVKDGSRIGTTSDNYPRYWGLLGSQTAPYEYGNVVATITEDPAITYTSAVRECDLAHDYPFSNSRNFSLYVNSETPITTAYHVEATDTVTKVGGQGRLVEVYKPTDDHDDARVVMIDTYLARVDKVTTAVLDAQGHVIVPAQLTVAVYDDTDNKNNPNTHVIVKGLTSAENWEYGVGDYLLLNAYSDWREGDGNPTAKLANDLNHDPTTTEYITGTTPFTAAQIAERQNKAAFEVNMVNDESRGGINHILVLGETTEIVGKAESFTGSQTSVTWNTGKHNVGGTEYNDAILFYLDQAQRATGTVFTWFKDQYGNIIGAVDTRTASFGVITDIWASFGQGDGNTDGNSKIFAKVKLSDNTETTLEISRFLVSEGSDKQSSGVVTGHAGNSSTGAANKSAELVPVYDYSMSAGIDIMTATYRTVTTNPTDAKWPGYLHVSPVASINKAADNNKVDGGHYGIVLGNLFQFLPGDNNTYTAIEVHGANTNDGLFTNFRSETTSGVAGNGKLYKGLSYVTLNGDTAASVWVDNDTKIFVRNPNTDAVTVYDGVSALPSNLTIAARADNEGEIDWTELDNDGRAEHLYVTGTFDGGITYALFYSNGGEAVWTGSEQDGTGTIKGWLNGEEATIALDDYARFTTIRNSYAGHMYALQLTDGVVSAMLGDSTDNDAFLTTNAYAAANLVSGLSITSRGTALATGTAGTGTPFVTSVAGGNPYTSTTMAVYYKDDGTDNVTYSRSRGTVSDGTQTYTITPSTKVIGLGQGVTVNTGEAALEYLNRSDSNDVTIVYENNAIRSIVEIYIATDPNVTPGGSVVPANGVGGGVNRPVGTVADADAFANILRNNPNTGVWYWDSNTPGYGSSEAAKNLLYFPFRTDGTNTHNAQLEISTGGDVVYRESITTITTAYGTNWIVIDWLMDGSNTSTGHWLNGVEGLYAGTYTYTITIDGGYVTGGTFTMV